MAQNKNIPQFTAADIERYHRGQLSNKEMHDLEKAAMDDPFLADALEGYAVQDVDRANDLLELQKRLAQRTEGAKVISLNTGAPRRRFNMLKAAIVIAFIAAGGLLIYQLGFNNKSASNDGIAQVKTTEPKKPNVVSTDAHDTAKATGTITPASNESATTTTKVAPKTTVQPVTTSPANVPAGPDFETSKLTSPSTNNPTGDHRLNAATSTGSEVLTVTTEVVTNQKTPAGGAFKPVEKKEQNKYKSDVAKRDDDGIAERKAAETYDIATNKPNTTTNNTNDYFRTVPTNTNSNTRRFTNVQEQNNAVLSQRYQAPSTYRGRVTDAYNNAVPFANVTNARDNNTGTYADANGNFTITSTAADSILTVQIHSSGYENRNVQLRNDAPTAQIVLQEDRNNLKDQVVLDTKKVDTAARNRYAKMKIEQPEPVDGWKGYNAYIENNVTPPEDIKDKKISGEVQVSFEVDKYGEPFNIKVVKSLCDKCDQEAIRLVKEGPKWKRKAKNGKATVTISF